MTTLFGTHSNYLFGRNVDDRQRLEYQFSLLREDFDLWLDAALRAGGLATDPDEANWSMLDVGCGEGQYARETGRRYPNASIVGFDSNAAAIDAASAAATGEPNLRFLVHDARQPLPDGTAPDGGFDVAVMWMVLLYLPDRQAALNILAANLAPGGVALLGNVPDEPLVVNHPDAIAISRAGQQALKLLGMTGLETELEPLLQRAGFGDSTTAVLRYPVGGATSNGHRWYRHALMSMEAGRSLLADVTRLMDGVEFDRHLDSLAATSVLEISGETRFLVTVTRRGS